MTSNMSPDDRELYCYREHTPAEAQFGAPEIITVEQVEPGDFVAGYPAQAGIAGHQVNSAVKAMWDDYAHWTRKQGRRRVPVSSRALVFYSSPGAHVLPLTHDITVRRPTP